MVRPDGDLVAQLVEQQSKPSIFDSDLEHPPMTRMVLKLHLINEVQEGSIPEGSTAFGAIDKSYFIGSNPVTPTHGGCP